MIHRQKRRKRVPAGQQWTFSAVREPNDVWSADFKGQFKTQDRTWCYPLTIMDHRSRYLLECWNCQGTGLAQTKKAFEKLFREYGLPWRIRTDNGVPFAAKSPGGLTQLRNDYLTLKV